MKNYKWLLVILVIIIGFSCGKNNIDIPDEPDELTGMRSLIVPADFNWEMSASYDLVLNSGSSGLIEVTSTDETVIYHRGSYVENDNNEYIVSLRLPTTITAVKINSTTVNLTGSTIDVDLSGFKSNSVLKGPGDDDDGDGVINSADDYPNDITRAYDVYWPVADSGSLVFEDLWPGYGDYDFNDMVLGYRFKTVTDFTNRVVEVFAAITVRAHGAQLSNGFGFELPNAASGLMTDLSVIGYNHSGSVITVSPSTGLEAGQSNPVVIVLSNVDDVMEKFVNTGDGPIDKRGDAVTITVTMTTLTNDYYASDFDLASWNPFIFIGQVRGYELHLAGKANTDLASLSYFGTFDDSTVIAANRYYVSATNLPWALDFPTNFDYPFEKRDISNAYLKFDSWATSGGVDDTDWYITLGAAYRDTSLIYTP